jgi:hypothetical protein
MRHTDKDSAVSRRAFITVSTATLAGTTIAAVPLVARAAPDGDAVLLDACAKLEAACAYNDRIGDRASAANRASFAEMPDYPEGVEHFSDEQNATLAGARNALLIPPMENQRYTASRDEQERLFETIIDPLKVVILAAVPTTLAGVAAKAHYILEHDYATWEDPDSTTLADFLNELAALGERADQ